MSDKYDDDDAILMMMIIMMLIVMMVYINIRVKRAYNILAIFLYV